MKKIVIFLVCILHCNFLSAQLPRFDSLKVALVSMPDDSGKVNALNKIAVEYKFINTDSAMDYGMKALSIARQLNWKPGVAAALHNVASFYYDKGNYVSAFDFYNKALNIRKEIRDSSGMSKTIGNIGLVFWNQGNLPEALANFFEALKIDEKLGNKLGIARHLGNIGNVYVQQGDYNKALDNYSRGQKIIEELGNKNYLAIMLGNIGNIYVNLKDYSRALDNFSRELKIDEELGNKIGISTTLGNIGLTLFNQSKTIGPDSAHYREMLYNKALENYIRALRMSAEAGDDNGIVRHNGNMGELYAAIMDNRTGQAKTESGAMAEQHLRRAIELGDSIHMLQAVAEFSQSLSELYLKTGKYAKSLEYYKKFIAARDSVTNDENIKKQTQLEMNYEFDKKEAATKAEQDKKDAIALKELQKQKLVRNGFIGGFAVVLLFAGVFFTQRNKIKKGKQRSDELLLNILPEEVAEELKAKGSADAKQFDDVTVMFTDFKDFTQISEKLSPAELVTEIHTCFKAFDNIITKFNIEKIKTIGDSYMCAGGLPVANTTNANDVVHAAIEIRDFMIARHSEIQNPKFEIRIGVHTGPVVAGIVGVKKFAYDIWGDTVNIASRMESSGEAGKVNISGNTYALVKDKFTCTHRGKIEAKNKGEIDMYFVERIS